MRIIGIICEYNPFHNGHKYQIDRIKEKFKDCVIIALCSSSFTQRAEISIVNKWDKARVALDNGIDLFVELPFVYATQSADIFARGAIQILDKLKVDTLVFGTESLDEDTLTKIAKIQINDKNKYDSLVKKYLAIGNNYPTSMSKALIDLCDLKVNKPNDLLALSYVKAILLENSNIKPVVIKRVDNYHNDITIGNIASASYIRALFKQGKDISKYIPKDSLRYLCNYNIEMFFNYLKYQIISNESGIDKIATNSEDLMIRIKRYISCCNSWEELISKVKTKRYTYNRINRTLLHILILYTKDEYNNTLVMDNNIRVLGFNSKGRKYLKSIKKEINIFTHNNIDSKHYEVEKRVSKICSLVLNNNLDKDEKSHKPIIK